PRKSFSFVGHITCIKYHLGYSFPQKRRCAFQVTAQNQEYTAVGNVSGSVQLCEKTQCCVGYFLNVDGRPVVDVLACDIAEKSCPDATCKTQTRFNGQVLVCVCNTDLCNSNSNITWTLELEDPQPSYFDKPKLCSCQTTEPSEFHIDDIELQQIVGHGHFATVWQGKYKGSTVAVKVFPVGWKQKFTAEKEVYELPLMNHAGIVRFLGSGSKPDGRSCLIVLQFAECGSLHSYLCKHTTNWMLTLKLCQSLSQGLSYLHSDLKKHGVHKPPVAHRDFSSSNVLVRADGTCVLCDFGCSTILRSCSGNHSWQSHITNMEGHAQLGTLRYMPPEILEGSVNLSSSRCLMQGDIYALGLLLWEIWMRCSDLFEGGVAPQHLLPYESELGANATRDSLIQYVFQLEKRPAIPKHWELLPQGSVLQELLTDCWDCDADARLTVECAVDRLLSFQSCYFP
uniref:receptor protein serine/threonine kinase n=1 Tax=Cyclopterus lumpus TaxID=8103 RepID=A0A8C2XC68_CYCLU